MTADGQIKTTTHFVYAGSDYTREFNAVISVVETMAPNTYRFLGPTGNLGALLPGVTGLGGEFPILPGFKIENETYIPIAFTGPNPEEIDYEPPYNFGFSLAKQ